jgi:hypothetical protein
MKIYDFSFKNEAVLSMIFNLIGLAVGGIILLVVCVIRWLN